jgi:hypothetical protein
MKKYLTILAAFLSVTATVSADFWYFSSERGRAACSENAKFVVYLTPGKQEEQPLIEVFQIKDSQELRVWQCRMGNRSNPLEVNITNDGKYVATVNNAGRAGYGDYVLAFYDTNGLIKNYSLEQILASLHVDYAEFDKSVPKSISSRWWDRYSVKFFSSHNAATYFCIWLDLVDRWVAWDPSNGRRVEVAEAMIKRLNNRTRLWAVKTIEEGSFALGRGPCGEETPYVFLSKLRKPEDRNIIERLLSDGRFNVEIQSSKQESLHYVQGSGMRSLGEKLLAKWDGRATEAPGPNQEHEQIYYYLGVVDGTIRLPHVPEAGDGTLWVYLVPAGIGTDQWHRKPPVHRLAASLDEFLISEDGPNVSRDFLFGVEGVTPGKYWLKAVWDKATPYCETYDAICLPDRGDFQGVAPTVVTVKAGQTVENILIDCMLEVTSATD